jgi:hypothetical protein
MPPRNRPPAHLPGTLLQHPLVISACREHDIGKLFRVINNLTVSRNASPPLTSHGAAR